MTTQGLEMTPQDSSTTYNLLLYALDIVKLRNAFFFFDKLWNAFDIEHCMNGHASNI